MYWHTMNGVLTAALVKVFYRVCEKGQNRVSKRELSLNHTEYGNFQKLRFHGLIAKYKEGGEWIKGTWLLTRRGRQFLGGEIRIPVSVQTFRNHIVAYSAETVTISEVDKKAPYYMISGDDKIDYADIHDMPKFKKDGQYILV